MKQQQTVDPHALGQQYNLGSFEAQYESSASLWLMFFLLMLILPLIIIWFAPSAGETRVREAVVVLFFLSALGFVIRFILKERKEGKFNAFVYGDGFIYCTSKGIVKQVIRWADIESVVHWVDAHYSSGSVIRSHRYKVI